MHETTSPRQARPAVVFFDECVSADGTHVIHTYRLRMADENAPRTAENLTAALLEEGWRVSGIPDLPAGMLVITARKWKGMN